MNTKVAQKEQSPTLEELHNLIIDSIQDKKGENTVSLNLQQVNDAVTDYFIVCDATTTVQVRAIADNIIHHVKQSTGEIPWHKEGFENLDWVLLDYVNIVVHVFRTEIREFYQLEELWADAERTDHE